MEIKEEGASEEGQHFLPAAQASDPGDCQFTSIQKTPNEPQLEFILGEKFHLICINKYKNLCSILQSIGTLLTSIHILQIFMNIVLFLKLFYKVAVIFSKFIGINLLPKDTGFSGDSFASQPDLLITHSMPSTHSNIVTAFCC
uniref:Inositol polyphosphate-4-phosphatase type II B n=1 Tax=Macaca fascicularis TaxID=9541 RepID=A0A7N9D6M4_MACFA